MSGIFGAIRRIYQDPAIRSTESVPSYGNITPLGKDTVCIAEREICTRLSSAGMREGIMKESRCLVERGISIDKSFRTTLSSVEHIYSTSKLSEEWRTIAQIFKDHLWKFRGIAGEAQHSVTDFANIFISDVILNPHISNTDRCIAIGEYIKCFEELKKNAQDLIEGFESHSRKVTSFKSNWGPSIDKQRNGLNISAIHELEHKVVATETDLDNYQHEVYNSTARTGVLELCSCPHYIISEICPRGWNELVGGISIASLASIFRKISQKRSVDEQKHKTLLENRKRLNSGIQDSQMLNVFLEVYQENISIFIKKITTVVSVYEGIQRDLKVFGAHFGSEQHYNDPNHASRVNFARELYLLLADILQVYQTSVNA